MGSQSIRTQMTAEIDYSTDFRHDRFMRDHDSGGIVSFTDGFLQLSTEPAIVSGCFVRPLQRRRSVWPPPPRVCLIRIPVTRIDL